MNALTSGDAARIFQEAAGAIESRGFTKHDREGVSGLTLDSAVCKVVHGLDGGDVTWRLHNDQCDEVFDRLLGFMLLAGITHLPTGRSQAADILATWNDERGRTAQEATSVLKGAAQALENQQETGNP